jgi:hypothetical protein
MPGKNRFRSDDLRGWADWYGPILPAPGVVVDSAGNLFVADTYNSTIRKGVPVISNPQPVFQTVALANGTFAFTWSAALGNLYQVQYTTNLAQANWINLGSTVSATNAVMSGTDSLSETQRFYRIQLMP